jgi:hypothetical protein
MNNIKFNKKYFEIYNEILKSPLGNTYQTNPQFENIDKIQLGQDGGMWIIQDTRYGKTWMRYTPDIDFNEFFSNIDDNSEFVRDVYYPQTKKILFDEETGIENKFGGSKPFFLKNEKWKFDSDEEPMVFLGQFIDPRKNDNILYRIFYSQNLSTDNYYLDKIELNEENLNNQIIIKSPYFKNIENDNYNNHLAILQPYIITNWTKTKELVNYKKINSKFNLPTENQSFSHIYDNHKYAPKYTIKIGGTYNYCQYNDEDEDENEDIIIQLTEQKFLDFQWGDSGVAHVYDNYIHFECY